MFVRILGPVKSDKKVAVCLSVATILCKKLCFQANALEIGPFNSFYVAFCTTFNLFLCFPVPQTISGVKYDSWYDVIGGWNYSKVLWNFLNVFVQSIFKVLDQDL